MSKYRKKLLKVKDNLIIFSRHPSHKIIRRKIPVTQHSVVRFGSTTGSKAPVQINSIESIENCTNKLIMKRLFIENEVSTPEIIDIVEDLDYNFKKPLVAKRTFRSKGKGMQLLSSIEEYNEFYNKYIKNNKYNNKNPYYLEIYYNYIKEYRIHVSSAGGYFYTNRKMLKSDADVRWYRNNDNCVWFLEENELFDKPSTWDNIVEECQKAREALGLDICGLDVRVNKKGDCMIIEANTACSFGDTSEGHSIVSEKYLIELTKLINNV
jgi:glutathione synthase/RimK-type ligase-like ATP-grasp enzyme